MDLNVSEGKEIVVQDEIGIPLKKSHIQGVV